MQSSQFKLIISKETIRFALKSNLIEDKNIGYTLVEAIDNRNKLYHEYWKENQLQIYIMDIVKRYYSAMEYVV